MEDNQTAYLKSLLHDNDVFLDLNVAECGYEECLQGKNVPENPRNYFTLHYINYGYGEVAHNGKTYKLSEGDVFLIYPGMGIGYKADDNLPWRYSWVVFNGRLSRRLIEETGFSENCIIKHLNDLNIKNTFLKLINCYWDKGTDAETIGRLYLLLAQLKEKEKVSESRTSAEILVRKAMYYIQTNYASELDAAFVASKMNISYNQLLLSFKKCLGITPKTYILSTKLNIARELILSRSIDEISDCAIAVGFHDKKYFSKCYKKYFGQTPFETICAVKIKEQKE